MAETNEQRAHRLLQVGLNTAARIREYDPVDVRRRLAALPPDELLDVAVLLAACVPVDLPESVLLGWWRHPQPVLHPCGTPAAIRRHRARGEPVDELCRFAERERDRVRKREERRTLRPARYGADLAHRETTRETSEITSEGADQEERAVTDLSIVPDVVGREASPAGSVEDEREEAA